MKKTLCLLLSLVLVTSTFVFAQAATTETPTVIYSFDAIYDANSPVSSAFNTNIAIEQVCTEGTGSTWMNFAIPTGQASGIGGMIFIDFATARDYSAYDRFKFDVYTPLAMQGVGGFLQFNFVTGSANQDGYNYNVSISSITTGWNTVSFDKSSYAAHANNADWKNINRIRITWFNEAQITRDFMLLDNLRGIVLTHTCTSASSYKSDGTYHWTTCTECGEVMSKASHSGGTATCTAAAKCSTCGASYGSKNANNHTGGTEVRNAKSATCGATGYTGDTYCKGCGVKTKTGTTIAATGNHSGGTATCTAKAKCTTCGTAYGSLNASNHTGGTEVRNAKSATCGAAGYTGDTYCKGCGVKTKSGSTIAATGNHSGGTATCTGQKLCSVCGTAYGSTNGSNHTGGTEVRNAKSATCGVAGYTGDTYCKGCGAKTATGSTIAATGKHTGGTATCNAKAKCTTCGLTYGSVNSSNHVGGTELRNVTDLYSGDTYCLGCSTVIAKGTAYDGIGVIFPFDEIYNSEYPVTSAFNADVAIEANAITEGIGSTRLGFNVPTGQASYIGGMMFIDFAAAKDLSAYQQLKIDIYTPVTMNGQGGMLQINFVSDSALQDGFNFNLDVNHLIAGWNTITFKKDSPTTHANNAVWTNIKRIRITWFNNYELTNVPFMLLDNLSGAYVAHQHAASGSIQYDGTYHWYNCSTVGCGVLVNQAAHSGGTATCTSAAKCTVCGAAYGSKNASNHTGGTEVRNATTAGCGSAGYTGDTYCLGCGVKTKTGTTISATSQHTGGTATCVAKAVCTVCGNAYGNTNASNHAHTEVRNKTDIYSGDTYCTDCGVLVKQGTATNATTAHTPYGVGSNLMINNADSLDGWQSSFNTTVSKGTQIKEGSGSVAMGSTIPQGQASSIGAMTKVVFPATDLSSYGSIRYRIYFSHALPGTHQFQTNFITGDGGDGYNHTFTFTDFAAGWHDFEIDIDSVPMAVTADWTSINAIRFTWFNAPQISTAVTFTIDEIMALTSIGHTPYKVGNDLMINNADSIDGWVSHLFNTTITAGTQVSEGSGSVTMNSTVPQGQASNIGAMTKLSFPATDLSSYDKISFKMYLSHTLTGTHQLQINFITGDGGDGYNHVITVADLSAGWHTVTIDRASIAMAATANWASINAIRFTWFNAQNISTAVSFTFDEIKAFVDSDHTHTATGSIQYDASYHWYNCATVGCGNLVNKGAHSGGTATCTAKAKCSTCGYSYGAVSTTNHTGGTEVRNASSTYTGDTYCLGCSAKISTGYSIGGSGVIFPFDEIYNSEYPVTSSFNADVAIESSVKSEGIGSTRFGFNVPTGQASYIGGMMFIDFATAKNLTAYQQFKIDIYTPVTMNSQGGMLQINFVSDSALQDGYNFNLDVNHLIAGWNTLTFDKNSFVTHANSADWANIKRIRITWFNNYELTNVPFMLLDNLSGAYSEHEHTATGSIRYDESYHWYNCVTIGCGNLVNKGAHSGGTATCNAKAKCSTCGYSYGAVSTTNHTGGTEVRNQSATYTGDTYCLGCGAMLAQGSGTTTPPVTGSAHAPYKVGSDLMINNADSTAGWDAGLFNTTITAGTQIKEGSGSVAMNSTLPQGQASNIGAMTKLNFASTDLSSYSTIRYRIHFSHALSGTHQFQTNFITGDGGDGYNYTFTFTDFAAGWHTFEINRASVPMAATADWSSINAIRFTWFNAQNISSAVTFTIDEVMALASGGHTPYAVGNDLMINNADSTNGWIPDMFNTSITAGTQISEGSGSVTATAKVPVGQDSGIGAMTKITFPSTDLSAYAKITFKVHFSHALSGTHQLQVNFITGEGGDGYNTVFTFTDYEAGWHTFEIDRASVPMAATADWTSINAIRFTWFNSPQMNTAVAFTFDDIRAVTSGAHTPYAVGENLMINNADATDGWEGYMHTSILTGTQIVEGTGSVTMDPLYPYGQASNIGAMSKVIFPATDLSSYSTIVYKIHLSDPLTGVHQFQTNFITGDGGDGYNYVYTFENLEAGWHTFEIDMASTQHAIPEATWTSINAIRFTWFNLEPISTAVKFTFDEIMALKQKHVCVAGPYIRYDETDHWYDCETAGCGLLVDKEAHYGGEATCISRALCDECAIIPYGDIDPNNHVNTELLNESESYTGDLYCYDCEKTVKKGTNITKAEATATVGTVKGSFKSGDKISIPVTITEWSNSYAYITVSVPQYNTSLLRFDGFSESSTGFQGAMVEYGSNGLVLIAVPTTASAASKLKGGEICVLNFTALAELKAPVTVSVNVKANGYAYGVEDEWTTDRPLLVETKAGGTAFNDTAKPSVSIGNVTTGASNVQAITLNFTDNGSIAGYYFGASSTYLNNTYVATTEFSATHSVSAAGKYYINVVDASGNVSSTVTVTFYMITLNANGGSLTTVEKIIAQAGSTLTLPTATRENYKFSGWATTSNATTGATSVTVTSNANYYAVWNSAVYGDCTGDSAVTSVDALYVLQAAVGTRTLTAEQKAYCDVNGDGQITSVDALHILQYSVGKRTSFDVEG